MTLNLLDLYNECAGQPWSMFDSDAETAEDLESALKISINKAISFLWNYQPWIFRMQTMVAKVKSGKNKYNVPEGIITRSVRNGNVKYGVKFNGIAMDIADDPDDLEDKTEAPTMFYLKGENIYLYPTPDTDGTLMVDYLLLPYGLNEEDEFLYELKEDGDYINVPEKYEGLFKNCVISLAMMYAIADESDENYSGYRKQYEDALAVLFKYCNSKLQNRRITW
jgi:hypothetical protein